MKTLYWVIIIMVIVIVGAISTYIITKPKKSQTEDSEIDAVVDALNGNASRM